MRRLVVPLAAVALLALTGAAGARISDAPGDSLIHADATRALGYVGAGVVVGVLDTGIDDRGTVIAEHCFVPPDGCPDGTGEQAGPGSARDDEGHGTAMADIVAGVAPGASFVVAKVTDHNGRTSTSQIVAGLNWILSAHPEVKVVNISLDGDILISGDCTNLTSSLRQYAAVIGALVARGTTVVASSGNNGQRISMPAPACFGDTVTVGAVYSRSFGSFTAPVVCKDTTTRADQLACFSNSGSQLDLLAVGAPVATTGYPSFAGTSAAAAQVSGAMAVLLGADQSLTPAGLLSLLRSTGTPISDPRNGITTPRIDLAAALGALRGTPVPLLPPFVDTTPIPTPVLGAPTVPQAQLAATRLSFGAVRRGAVKHANLVVRNVGSGHLAVRVSSTPALVSAAPARLTIDGGGRGVLRLTYRASRSGVFKGVLRLTTDDPSAPLLTVSLSATVSR